MSSGTSSAILSSALTKARLIERTPCHASSLTAAAGRAGACCACPAPACPARYAPVAQRSAGVSLDRAAIIPLKVNPGKSRLGRVSAGHYQGLGSRDAAEGGRHFGGGGVWCTAP